MRIVRLAQHPPLPTIAENAAAATQPVLGQRGDRPIAREKARQNLVARKLIVAELHLYLTR